MSESAMYHNNSNYTTNHDCVPVITIPVQKSSTEKIMEEGREGGAASRHKFGEAMPARIGSWLTGVARWQLETVHALNVRSQNCCVGC